MKPIKINLFRIVDNAPQRLASRFLWPVDKPALRMTSLERERQVIRQWILSETTGAHAADLGADLGDVYLELGEEHLVDAAPQLPGHFLQPHSRMFLIRFATSGLDGGARARDSLYNEYDAAGLVLLGALPLNHVMVGADLFLSARFSQEPVFAAFALKLALNLLRAGNKASVLSVDCADDVSADDIVQSAYFVRKLCGYVPARFFGQVASLAVPDALALTRRLHCALNLDENARRELGFKTLEVEALRRAGLPVSRPFDTAFSSPAEKMSAAEVDFSQVPAALGETSVDEPWKHLQLARTRRALGALRILRKHDTCVIAGNGPSLSRTDLSVLDDADVFISNFAVYSPLLLSKANYLTVTNPLLASQEPAVFNLVSGLAKIAPLHLASNFHERAGWLFANAIDGAEFCGNDPAGRISWASTVTFFNLQLAYFLGYRHVKLIGVDNAYQQPATARFGKIISQQGDDQNHFDPLYFRGRDWQAADTDEMAQVYQLAAEAFRQDGRTIENLSASEHAPQFDAARPQRGAAPSFRKFRHQEHAPVVAPVQAAPFVVSAPNAAAPAAIFMNPDRMRATPIPAAPIPAAPIPEAPAVTTPNTLAPNTLAPKTLAPNTLASKTLAPNTGAPNTGAPKTHAPMPVAPPLASSRKAVHGQAEICEEMLDASYGHLNFAFYDVAAGQKRWHYFGCKFQNIADRSYLELRFQDIKPFAFIRSPRGVKKDQWGEYLRIFFCDKGNRTARALDAFLADLSEIDQQAYSGLLPVLARKATELIGARADASPVWLVMSQDFEHVVDLSVQRLMQPSAAAV